MDPLSIGMLAILAVLIFFMFRNGQKRKRDIEEKQTKVVPGASVMTNFGVFGTILSVNDDKVEVETSPGNVLTVHRQTIVRFLDDEPAPVDETEDDVLADDAPEQINEDHAAFTTDPEFGERVDPIDTKPADSREKNSDQ
ncbi:preprotein translocase subunit YajC [Mycetocola sp. CAN_C7]|uniref:preprotein translocase subunit YajC n=1 Tax=Mycetocola sp. CAN_C7 TaxID=2787724 RepID=UPI0018C9744A